MPFQMHGLVVLAFLGAVLLPPPPVIAVNTDKGSQTNAKKELSGYVLVKLATSSDTAKIAKGHSLEDVKKVGSTGWRQMKIKDTKGSLQKVQELIEAGVQAEPIYEVYAAVTPNDPAWTASPAYLATAMQRISAPAAWDIHTGSQTIGPTVCIIDTGISFSHPDLVGNVFVDGSYNAITNVAGAAAEDDNSHGTHCAGTIGGVGNNNAGVAGVAWRVRMITCKFLSSSGSGSTADAAECVAWCRAQGAKITSNSWGGGGYSQALYDEIKASRDAGHLFVVAAGNANQDINATPSYPASYDLDNIISVGASDPTNDARASFSNYGATQVDLFAPGVNIYSTVLAGSYGLKSGTSMACPHVAGASALLWSYAPSLTYSQVKAHLMSSVDKVAGLAGTCVTGGRLNLLSALKVAGVNPPADPTVTVRLVNGPSSSEGRVEVWYNGQWGTVCDDAWDALDAKVVCRQLGLPTAYAQAYGGARYGQNPAVPIMMDDVACRGTEGTLQSCPHIGPTAQNCAHSKDAGVACPSTAPPDPVSPTIRLVNGRTSSEGRVEVLVGGRWGTVCDDLFGSAEARVICRQLGLPSSSASAKGNAYFGQNSALPIVMDDLGCKGNEATLQACKYKSVHNCQHYEDAGVICAGTTTTTTSDVPLPADKDDFSKGGNGNGKDRKLIT
mmetsp:Transcript_28545/g.62834  ORF Transcript_28545/g.62834 Transcript_28545/m.62834 type:complete len:671 (-) Transcript_28545:1338-3350(-)